MGGYVMHDLKVLPPEKIPISRSVRTQFATQIRENLQKVRSSVRELIRERELYFRISVTGACNLSCQFCHNEGGPQNGVMTPEIAEAAIVSAVSLGFTRIQFTGGEPLLRKDISEFVKRAKRYVEDIGITTNGTYLLRELDKLVESGISRIHVSLQTESLVEAGSEKCWGIPDWLLPTITRARSGEFILRLNLPVPADAMTETERFLILLEDYRCDIKVFSVLPEGGVSNLVYPLGDLESLVEGVNHRRDVRSISGKVLLRGFRPPAGIRCPTCDERLRCREQSHSLRLGADLVLRPCLASRAWDIPLQLNSEDEVLLESTLLALDY
jgi:molybdenum cofactor biosynthesis enzyme MoaA